MKELQDRILAEGQVLGGGILKVDSFVNHQVDPLLMDACGREFARRFASLGATKVLTAEISGIAPGQHAYVTDNFTPGTYGMVCFVPDAKDARAVKTVEVGKRSSVSIRGRRRTKCSLSRPSKRNPVHARKPTRRSIRPPSTSRRGAGVRGAPRRHLPP